MTATPVTASGLPGTGVAGTVADTVAAPGLSGSGLPEFLVPGLPYSAPELRSMEDSGSLVHVMGDLYLPSHHGIEGTLVRSAAIHRLAAPVLSGAWTTMGLAAAWLFTGGTAPGALEVSVEHFHRRPLQPMSVGLRLEQSNVAGRPADVVRVWGLACTSVERTIEDLLRRAGDPAQAGGASEAVAAAGRLLPLTDATVLRDRFEERRRRPGMAGARRALETLLGPRV